MKLHEDEKLFRQAVQATADQLKIKDIYVEKDYWVTLALHRIFLSEAANFAVFKGGTALSKCYGIIDRFSEDIDLVVLTDEKDSGGEIKRKLKSISQVLKASVPEIEIAGVTNKKGEIRKTAHTYPKLFTGTFGQIRDIIVLESSVLGNYEPSESRPVRTFIHDMMMAEQKDMIEKYGLQPFDVKVLMPTRTLCEKIMSLVRFSYSADPINGLKLKVRHLYDIHQILQQQVFSDFFESKNFDVLLTKVGQDDLVGYKSGNLWLKEHPAEAYIFKRPEEVWNEIKKVYSTSFADLVYGILPEPDEILKDIQRVSVRLEKLEWKLEKPSV